MEQETSEQAFERRLRELDAIVADPNASPEEAFDAAEGARLLRKAANVTIWDMLLAILDAKTSSYFQK
jgi:hypothetical protein